MDNGLTVIANRHDTSRLAAVNIIYKVGARNENPERTGFAHLFEHLMFGGSRNVPDFDLPVQKACGENNAFTNNDYTDYYITLPNENLETALWIESDRMGFLTINEERLETERKVVVEEFNQRYLNQPYGDLWLLLRPLAYTVHPYRWPTIGITPEHVMRATLDDVRAFYERYYNPSNAILSVSGDIAPDRIFSLAEKWFGGLPSHAVAKDEIPVEPVQTAPRRLEVERDVPSTAIVIAFRMGRRVSREFNVCDVASDILSGGTSSRLYRRLVQDRAVFSSVNAYVTGDVDEGLFIVTGNINPGVEVSDGEAALWSELELMKKEPVGDYELQKVNNKFESGVIFGELNVMNRAMNMGFYEMLGDIDMINREVELHSSVTKKDIMDTAERLFVPDNSSTLIYKSRG